MKYLLKTRWILLLALYRIPMRFAVCKCARRRTFNVLHPLQSRIQQRSKSVVLKLKDVQLQKQKHLSKLFFPLSTKTCVNGLLKTIKQFIFLFKQQLYYYKCIPDQNWSSFVRSVSERPHFLFLIPFIKIPFD